MSENARDIIYRVEAEVLNNNAVAFDDVLEFEKRLAKEYIKAGKEINLIVADMLSRVNEWSYVEMSKYNRLKQLMEQINKELSRLGRAEIRLVTRHLEDTLITQYMRTVYAIGKGINVKMGFNRFSQKYIETTLNYPWSGAMFSDRIWDNKKLLLKRLREGLTQSMILGEGVSKIAKRINDGINNAYLNAQRVARTEVMRVCYVAERQALEDNGIKKVQYSAFFDGRTCDKCKKLDGKIYTLGKELPLPRHPHCRCTYLPVLDKLTDKQLNEATQVIRNYPFSEFRRRYESKLYYKG